MLCNILKIVRMANFLTIVQASKKSGVSQIYIQELERGTKKNISEIYLSKLANAYNLQLHHITELVSYYNSLEVDNEKRKRLVLMKALEMIEGN